MEPGYHFVFCGLSDCTIQDKNPDEPSSSSTCAHEKATNMTPLSAPSIDPTAIFETFRGIYGSELLTAAIAHFDVFGGLVQQPRSLDELQQDLGLAERPVIVLTTALRAMGCCR
jgi:hypothetical protein